MAFSDIWVLAQTSDIIKEHALVTYLQGVKKRTNLRIWNMGV